MILRSAIDALASVLFPAPCRICDHSLVEASRIPVCGACLERFRRIEEPVCRCCGRPLTPSNEVKAAAAAAAAPVLPGIAPPDPDAEVGLVCPLCCAGTYGFNVARSFAIYDDPLARAVVLLKYDRVAPLGAWLAERLEETIGRWRIELEADIIVPVPLHADRLRERGYNQAEMIARPLAKRLGLKLGSYLLVRTRPRPPRLILTRDERWESVRGAYATRKGVRVDKLRVLLVDDVFTTGATLDACSRALREAGAAEVKGLTVGRVVPERVPAEVGYAADPDSDSTPSKVEAGLEAE